MNEPHWTYWGNMPETLSHVTEEMAAASRKARDAVLDKIPPGYASDVGEASHMRERAERAGIAAALAARAAPTVTDADDRDMAVNAQAAAIVHHLHDPDIAPEDLTQEDVDTVVRYAARIMEMTAAARARPAGDHVHQWGRWMQVAAPNFVARQCLSDDDCIEMDTGEVVRDTRDRQENRDE